MKKILTCLLLLAAIISYAQETKEVAAGIHSEAEKATDVADTSKIHWKTGGTINISGQQVSLTNWAAGGQSAISGSGLVSLFANYSKGKLTWSTNLDLAYGVIKQASNRKWWKNDDRIQFTSKVGHYAFKNTYYTALVDFKSQFAPGYNYPNDSVQISNFLAPAYGIVALGLDFKPTSYMSFFIAPVTTRITIVNDDSLAKHGAFGVQKQVSDTAGHIITPYKKIRVQYGGYFKMMFKKDIMENITFATVLELFSDYLHNPQNLYVNWTTLTSMKVNKFISATLSTQLIYDDAVMIKDKDGKTGPRLQIKQVLGVGLSYKF
ncbi:MAG TPA: DUF3078 domain-containing protein [Bacteroidia bacterium]|jgi:hypothetical protein|nr:DUF3078 domain-containing protein [Bacteroidia bacterium]